MCIICRGEYNGETRLECAGCTSLTSLPKIPNVTHLDCGSCTSLLSLPEISNVTQLYCYNCTSITSLPPLSNVTYLDCSGCTSLVSLPPLPNVTHLYCWGCTSLTSLPAMPNLTTLYSGSCAWLNHSSNSEYTINITRLTHLQRWYRRMVWCRYLSSKEFIEWCYHPDNIGGKQAKKSILAVTKTRNTE